MWPLGHIELQHPLLTHSLLGVSLMELPCNLQSGPSFTTCEFWQTAAASSHL